MVVTIVVASTVVMAALLRGFAVTLNENQGNDCRGEGVISPGMHKEP
jgi:hypothetical protein